MRRGREQQLIYLAVPYTGTPEEEAWRAKCASHVAGCLTKQGIAVYSPISEGHAIRVVHPDLPGTWDYWGVRDRLLLDACRELWILQLRGWETSVGLYNETRRAKLLRYPIGRLDPRAFGINEDTQTIDDEYDVNNAGESK